VITKFFLKFPCSPPIHYLQFVNLIIFYVHKCIDNFESSLFPYINIFLCFKFLLYQCNYIYVLENWYTIIDVERFCMFNVCHIFWLFSLCGLILNPLYFKTFWYTSKVYQNIFCYTRSNVQLFVHILFNFVIILFSFKFRKMMFRNGEVSNVVP
jgi:hypothetical protein